MRKGVVGKREGSRTGKIGVREVVRIYMGRKREEVLEVRGREQWGGEM
jgi:hypothetical protein